MIGLLILPEAVLYTVGLGERDPEQIPLVRSHQIERRVGVGVERPRQLAEDPLARFAEQVHVDDVVGHALEQLPVRVPEGASTRPMRRASSSRKRRSRRSVAADTSTDR